MTTTKEPKQNSKAVWIILILIVVWVIWLASGTNQNRTVRVRNTSAPSLARLTVKTTTCSKDSAYATVGGTVKNDGSVTVEFVQLKVSLISGGDVVDTDSTYAVGAEGLSPGEQSTFEWMFSNPPSFDQCRATVFDYDTP